MKRLTEEQAEWLLQEFDHRHKSLMKQPAQGMFHLLDCRAIIDQCTERKFPEFKTILYEQHQIEKNQQPDLLVLTQPGDCSAPIELFYRSVEGHSCEFLIPTDKFLEFAEGVEKIKDWLANNQ